MIFAFYVAFYGAIARMKTGLAGKLKFGSFLGIRIPWPLIAYFFLVSPKLAWRRKWKLTYCAVAMADAGSAGVPGTAVRPPWPR